MTEPGKTGSIAAPNPNAKWLRFGYILGPLIGFAIVGALMRHFSSSENGSYLILLWFLIPHLLGSICYWQDIKANENRIPKMILYFPLSIAGTMVIFIALLFVVGFPRH